MDHQGQAQSRLLRRARSLSYVVVALLIVTAIFYTIFASSGLADTQTVFSDVQNGYWTSTNTTNPNGSVTYSSSHVAPANNTTSPAGSMPIAPYFGFLKWSVLVDLAIVWFLVVFTIFSVTRPSNLRDPSKLLDIFYMNLLFGVVFWPLAALGAYLGTLAGASMLILGLLPAVVITMFVSRFVEEGTGGPLVMGTILGAMIALILLNTLLWAGFLSGGDLALVAGIQFLFPGAYFLYAYTDRTESIKTRPLVAELLLWGGLGVVFSTIVGVIALASFGGATLPLLATTALFTGSTDLLSAQMQPWTFINAVAPTSSGMFIANTLPLLFGITGVLTAILSVPPLLAVGDFLGVRAGSSVAEICQRCKRPYIVLKSQDRGYCEKCRVDPTVLRSLRDAGNLGGPTGAPPPTSSI